MRRHKVVNMSLSEVTHTDLAEAIVSDKTASLILTGNLLTRLPSNMPEKVPNLSVLKVDKNSLSHFPMPIVQMKNLTKLVLSFNHLSDIPTEISQLTHLKKLILSYNRITRIPHEISRMWYLQELDLSHNQLTSLPWTLSDLIEFHSLTTLHLVNNPLVSPRMYSSSSKAKIVSRDLIRLRHFHEIDNVPRIDIIHGKPLLLERLGSDRQLYEDLIENDRLYCNVSFASYQDDNDLSYMEDRVVAIPFVPVRALNIKDHKLPNFVPAMWNDKEALAAEAKAHRHHLRAEKKKTEKDHQKDAEKREKQIAEMRKARKDIHSEIAPSAPPLEKSPQGLQSWYHMELARKWPLMLDSRTFPPADMSFFLASQAGDAPDAPLPPTATSLADTYMGFFAVYDGHGGNKASDYLEYNLHVNLFNRFNSLIRSDVEDVLKETFKQTDEQLIAEMKQRDITSGSTAAVALLLNNTLFAAWTGDSRIVLCRSNKAIDLTIDHKPSHPAEKARIEAAGGTVTEMSGVPRVNGLLAMSRSFGDIILKDKGVLTCEPEVVAQVLGPDDQFFVLASDGVFDHFSNQEVVDIVRRSKYPARAAEEICSLAKTSSYDNISCIIVWLQWDADGASAVEPPKMTTLHESRQESLSALLDLAEARQSSRRQTEENEKTKKVKLSHKEARSRRTLVLRANANGAKWVHRKTPTPTNHSFESATSLDFVEMLTRSRKEKEERERRESSGKKEEKKDERGKREDSSEKS